MVVLRSANKTSMVRRLFYDMGREKLELDDNYRMFSALKSAQFFLEAGDYESAKLMIISAIQIFLTVEKQWEERRRPA